MQDQHCKEAGVYMTLCGLCNSAGSIPPSVTIYLSLGMGAVTYREAKADSTHASSAEEN